MRPEDWVEETPGINGGFPVVAGTRTPISVLVEFHRQGANLDEIATLMEHLTREQVEIALQYYDLHPERVGEDIARNQRAQAEYEARRWSA
jgi:uncharacterized protein (DUF433 family)